MGYNNAEVAHRFATGIGERCTGSNMFFEGNIIYSYGYHFPMAIKYNGYLLYNDERYSKSTCKHQNYVGGACSHMDIVHCASLGRWDSWHNCPLSGFVKLNLEIWADNLDDLVKKMAASPKPEKWLSEIHRLVKKVERFCEVFEASVPEAFHRFNSKEEIEKAREYAKAEARANAERERKRQAVQIEAFNAFDVNWVDLPYEIVRYNSATKRFETSKHVEIPAEIGKRFYEAVRDGNLREGDKVLHYRVNKVGDTIEIGCHTFRKRYILDYGKKMFNE